MNRIVRHGQEIVLRVGGHIQNFAARHHVVIHIDGIDRIGHQHGVIHVKEIQQIAQIALGAIRNKDFAQIQRNTMGCVILADGLPQELIALLTGNIAVEGFLMALFLHRSVHGVHHRAGQRQRHVADAQTDDVPVRVGGLVGGDLVGDGAKEIALVQFGIMFVELHGFPPVFILYP